LHIGHLDLSRDPDNKRGDFRTGRVAGDANTWLSRLLSFAYKSPLTRAYFPQNRRRVESFFLSRTVQRNTAALRSPLVDLLSRLRS
jgi:hypothetical protein